MDAENDFREQRDEGLVLIPTLILTMVVSVVVVAVLSYVATGISTSRVTTERTEDANVASAAMYWAIEMLANGDGQCVDIVAPAAAMPHREPVTVTCPDDPFDVAGAQRVKLNVALDEGSAGRVTALVDYRPGDAAPRPVRIYSWDSGIAPAPGG